jgi:hypothetical protein
MPLQILQLRAPVQLRPVVPLHAGRFERRLRLRRWLHLWLCFDSQP